VIHAARHPSVGPADARNENIAVRKRADSATGRRNEGGGYARVKKSRMIHLQHLMVAMLQSFRTQNVLSSAAGFVEKQDAL